MLFKLGLVSSPAIQADQTGHELDPKIIWMHALSVGEVISALPLVKSLRDRISHPIVFSASTMTGYTLACERLQHQASAVIYAPYDLRFSINRILDRIRPAIVLIVETDAWPNLLDCLRQRRIPALMINARLSDRSLAGYRRFKAFTALLFPRFSKILTQTEEDSRRFRQLGVPANQLMVTGNLKFDQDYPPLSENEKEELKMALGIQPESSLIVAGSTHEGEEVVIAEAFNRIRKDHPDLILINAPRDPGRSKTIAHLYQDKGLTPGLWSERNRFNANSACNVIIIDTIGLLVKLYAICDIAIVGGSLLDIHGIGGHNPLEPAAFSKPVIFGKNMRNFRQIAGMLENAGGALTVDGAGALSSTLGRLLDDPQRANKIGENAYNVFNANKGAVSRTIKLVLKQMEPITPIKP